MGEDRKEQLLKEQRHYDTANLNKVFAVSAIALLLVTLWSVLDDYRREWKEYQRQFNRIEVARLESEIGKTQAEIDAQRQADLEQQQTVARAEMEANSERIEAIDAELSAMAIDLYTADQNFRFTKALMDTGKFAYEEATQHYPGKVEAAEAELRRLETLLAEYDDVNKTRKGSAAALESERRELTAGVDRLQSEMDDLNLETVRLQRSLSRLDRPLTDGILNAPMLDFINPTLKIKQAVVEDLQNDINFLSIPRVDRCQSCHLAIDRKEYVGGEEPFRTHHSLDLIGSSASPHPFEQIGCTICHMGRDRATGFTEAVHMPDSAEDRERWENEHHWHRMHHWEDPMLPSRYVEAGCLQCHMNDVFLPGAEKLSKGKRLFETLGCHGCHKVAGWEDLRNVGPPLQSISVKTDREWMRRWLANPRKFRPTTRMPRFWFLGNSSSAEDRVRNNVEIDGVVEYLFAHSSAPSYPDPPRGQAEKGKALVETLGCHGCHSAIGSQSEQAAADPRSHGPNLMRIGDKTSPAWLYQWVTNPKTSWPETFMPDLRLTEGEAADVTAYLASLDDSAWRNDYQEEFKVEPAQMDHLRDEMILGYMMRKLTRGQAEAELAEMSVQDRRLMVGEKAIAHYGCFGCHNIPGFEGTQRIGTELTREGSKYVEQLDFGFAHLDHERPDWFFQKLKDPRIFDEGKLKSPKEKLKMPDFALTDDEAEALVTVIMGLRKQEVRPHRKKNHDARETAIQAGKRLVADYNCVGCHLVEGRGGDIRPWIQKLKAREGIGANEALAFAPPDLHTEGAKVQSDWLFSFLKDVTPIRPWLETRMPSFHFEDDQVNTLTAFFAALEDVPYPFVDYSQGFRLTAHDKSQADLMASKDYLNCLSCHQAGEQKPTSPPDSWAPDLALARQRLRSDWIQRWLTDPQQVTPGTRMPSFFLDEDSGPPDILDGDEAAQMELLARWVMSLGEGRRTAAGGGR